MGINKKAIIYDSRSAKSKTINRKTWGDYGTYAQIYKDLLIENEDKTLMLKALTSKWRVF